MSYQVEITPLLQEFITIRAQQQPSPEAAEFFERFQEHFDAEREPEWKLFHQHEQNCKTV